ncbi:MAG: hypothetical protein IAE79_27140 [Anaerolinea sp.]|nr:hypothetical protein [Anaerolinea sp.]
MKKRFSANNKVWSIILSAVLLIILLSISPIQPAQAAITGITINYYPLNIPVDSGGPCTSQGTPFAVRITVQTSIPNENFAAKIRFGTGGCTWNPATATWTTDTTAFTSLPRGTTDESGMTTMWLYGRAASTATTMLTVRARACDATFSACPTPNVDSASLPITLMDMSTSGGWLEESTGTDRASRAVAVFDDTNLVGLYVAKLNGVNDGYANDPGYYRVAVPDCTDCNYIIETWELNNPGTAVGQINTMGSNGCANTVVAGAIQSLNNCNTPTAVTLQSTSANSATLPRLLLVVVGLMVGGTAVVAQRRKA